MLYTRTCARLLLLGSGVMIAGARAPFLAFGRHRWKHYSQQAVGVTLAAFWADSPDRERAVQWLRRFQQAVDKAFPGYFRWFPEDSLHVTVRGIWEAATEV